MKQQIVTTLIELYKEYESNWRERLIRFYNSTPAYRELGEWEDFISQVEKAAYERGKDDGAMIATNVCNEKTLPIALLEGQREAVEEILKLPQYEKSYVKCIWVDDIETYKKENGLSDVEAKIKETSI